ncbi:MAG: NarK/NasA family nitrate transporter [Pseudonocardia sp.]|jgi:NNP family nitrate/nitrite transporter-like MFS transporter|nr:NarK/NasA family nitrate transporter [Pseudonocardia sp.]MDT7612638.1 transporter, family, nitrate/nitrite transporter [Pseudonocardiales bacterium]
MTGSLLSFWTWALISPLGAAYRAELDLSAFQQAFLVAVPVVVGSVGRIPVGALTDRFGSRVMFRAVSVLTIAPVLFVGFIADTYPLLIVGGFLLGIGGTAFAVGVPLVSAWFPPQRRGLALVSSGSAWAGPPYPHSSRSASPTPTGGPLPSSSWPWCSRCTRRSPRWRCATHPDGFPRQDRFLARTWETVRLPAVGQMSLLYAVSFGGFVAFSVYLPPISATPTS